MGRVPRREADCREQSREGSTDNGQPSTTTCISVVDKLNDKFLMCSRYIIMFFQALCVFHQSEYITMLSNRYRLIFVYVHQVEMIVNVELIFQNYPP